jgi:transmembrane sensor
MADGQPISVRIADQAAEWLTHWMSGEMADADHRRLQAWRDAHPDHERAWKHIEAVTGGLGMMKSREAYKTLSPYADRQSPLRRRVLSVLMCGGVAGVAGGLSSRTQTWRTAFSDYRTATGEQRALALSDGTRIMLNTASAIDVRFDTQQRLVSLVAGEIMVVTGHASNAGAADARPFIVETREGRVRALGTRFTVRQSEEHTAVTVLQSAVEITPRAAAGQSLILHAHQRTTFSAHEIDSASAATDQDSAWTRGQIVADNLRLADFLAELSRYRPGIVRCDPSVAALRLSGVFPLDDTDRILATLQTVLPVRVGQRTRYWVVVHA